MKHGNVFFMQVSRGIRDNKHRDLSIGARALFLELNELEQRYCSDGKTFFYRTDEQLAHDMGVSLGSLKKYKKELREKAKDLVLIQKCHFKDAQTGKLKTECFTAYTLLPYEPQCGRE